MIEGLPGEEIVRPGLEDLAAGRVTAEALLVAMAAPRLIWLGLEVPSIALSVDEPEMTLFHLLGADGEPDPYGRYNALRRRLDSFCRGLEQRVFRRKRLQGPA